MRNAFLVVALGLGSLGCSSDGGFGVQGSPAWKLRTSEAEQNAFYSKFKPYDEVMLNGEVLTSNMDSGNVTITQVSYNGRIYTCKAYDSPFVDEQRQCKS